MARKIKTKKVARLETAESYDDNDKIVVSRSVNNGGTTENVVRTVPASLIVGEAKAYTDWAVGTSGGGEATLGNAVLNTFAANTYFKKSTLVLNRWQPDPNVDTADNAATATGDEDFPTSGFIYITDEFKIVDDCCASIALTVVIGFTGPAIAGLYGVLQVRNSNSEWATVDIKQLTSSSSTAFVDHQSLGTSFAAKLYAGTSIRVKYAIDVGVNAPVYGGSTYMRTGRVTVTQYKNGSKFSAGSVTEYIVLPEDMTTDINALGTPVEYRYIVPEDGLVNVKLWRSPMAINNTATTAPSLTYVATNNGYESGITSTGDYSNNAYLQYLSDTGTTWRNLSVVSDKNFGGTAGSYYRNLVEFDKVFVRKNWQLRVVSRLKTNKSGWNIDPYGACNLVGIRFDALADMSSNGLRSMFLLNETEATAEMSDADILTRFTGATGEQAAILFCPTAKETDKSKIVLSPIIAGTSDSMGDITCATYNVVATNNTAGNTSSMSHWDSKNTASTGLAGAFKTKWAPGGRDLRYITPVFAGFDNATPLVEDGITKHFTTWFSASGASGDSYITHDSIIVDSTYGDIAFSALVPTDGNASNVDITAKMTNTVSSLGFSNENALKPLNGEVLQTAVSFYNTTCSTLVRVDRIGSKVSELSPCCFSGCFRLGSVAFKNSQRTSKLFIPGYAAFAHCYSLKHLDLYGDGTPSGGHVSMSGDNRYAFLDCPGLTGVVLPSDFTMSSVAFYDMDTLKTVDFSHVTATSIPSCFMGNCPFVKEIDLQSFSSFPGKAFCGIGSGPLELTLKLNYDKIKNLPNFGFEAEATSQTTSAGTLFANAKQFFTRTGVANEFTNWGTNVGTRVGVIELFSSTETTSGMGENMLSFASAICYNFPAGSITVNMHGANGDSLISVISVSGGL